MINHLFTDFAVLLAISLYQIRLTVYDIPSIEHSGKLCGSVSFGESFMDSVILTHSDEGDVSFSSDVIVLTSSIVRVTSWMVR